MLRASFLLFSLLLGAARGDSLFSREAIFCGGGGGGDNTPDDPTTRTCSILVGDGLCLAANDYWYPMCHSYQLESKALSKEVCQNLAVNKSDATGWTYVSGFDDVDNKTYAECILYVDATNVEYKQNYTCPDNGLNWYKDFDRFFSVGTGPIQTTAVGYPGYPCYTCALTYTPQID